MAQPEHRPAPVLVVMAAGMGSRYGGMKQVEPVGPGGQTIMEYSLYDAVRAGFTRAVFVVSPQMERDFAAEIRARVGGALAVDFAVQRLDDLPAGARVPEGREKPWGTGHAIRACRDVFDAPFAAINADDHYGPKGLAAIHAFLSTAAPQRPARYAMVGYALARTLSMEGFVSRGICRTDAAGRLKEIHERTHIVWSSDGPLAMEEDTYRRIPPDAIASMNLWGFSRDFLGELDARFARFVHETMPQNPLKAEFFLPEVVGEMLREGSAEVQVLESPESWHGMTYREDLPVVRRAIAGMTEAGVYPQRLWG